MFLNGKRLIAILGLAITFGFTSFNSLAAIDSTSCNNCTDAQMRQKAENSVRQQGTSYIVVIDYKQQRATKFRLSLGFDFGEPTLNARPVVMSADEQHDVDIFYQYRQAYLDVIRAAEELPIYNSKTGIGVSSGKTSNSIRKSKTSDNSYDFGELVVIGTPYDYLQQSYLRNRVYDHYISQGKGTFSRLLSSTLGKINIPLTKDIAIKLTIKFFDDNEATIYTGELIVLVDPTGEQLNVISGRDAADNSIPLKQSDVSGGAEFGFYNTDRAGEFLGFVNLKYPTKKCWKVESKDNSSGGFVITYTCN